MLSAAFELNDAGIVVVDDRSPDEPLFPPSPGYALLEGRTVRTGAAAASRARLAPRAVHHRFWVELDTAPLGRPFPRGLSRADLAHEHLSAVWEALPRRPDEVLLAVSGAHDARQLGLMLGIARACGMQVRGLTDSAVAAGLAAGFRGRLIHVDIQLHRAVLSELTADDEIVRGELLVADGAGLVPAYDAMARRVADAFVRQTRFDPLHAGDTEQQLYDGLSHWMGTLCREESCAVHLRSTGGDYAIELRAADLEPALGPLCERISTALRPWLGPDAAAPTLLLPERLVALPGFEGRIAEATGARIATTPVTAAASGTLAAADRIRSDDDELPFVKRLPRSSRALDPREPTLPLPPTHVVLDGIARPLARAALPAGTLVLQPDGAVLDGDGNPLRPGDRLRLGNPPVELTLIRIADDDDGPTTR